MLTLISHIFNESTLLPYWLKHHVELFDEGIIVDYKSTDDSLDIVRELAPHWKIITSKNEYFDALLIDQEIMEIERRISSWKMVLNTTEFLLKKNLKEYIQSFDNSYGKIMGGIRTNGVIMVDSKEEKDMPLSPESLIFQKHFGFFETEKVPIVTRKNPYITSGCKRQRLIHKYPDGKYGNGRHTTSRYNYFDCNLILLWFGLSPYDLNKKRRLQIFEKMSERDKNNGKGIWTITNEEEFDHYYNCMLEYSGDLRFNLNYDEELKQFL